ncbi:MAG TPA: DUF502 domain-containing protein [Dehalococcoidia bacterium]|nr:DUF502 domain-containing protein [Dehalococcoidia bacterium]
MRETSQLSWRLIGKKMRRQLLTGIIVVVPLGATILILVWIFTSIDNILQPVIQLIVGRQVPGVGFGITIVLIYLVGVIASNVGGKKLIKYGESLLAKIPVFRPLYSSIKQILESFSSSGKTGLVQTVLVEFPRKGIWTVGFITNESPPQSGKVQLSIFIPTSPNPTSGFLQIVSEDEVVRTDIPVDEALKMVVSAGKISPEKIYNKLSERNK